MSIAESNSKSIELHHVGPVNHLSIPVPDGGGVVVLRGRNGSGKSHAIEGVESLYSKEARKGLRSSDGVPSGTVEGLGVSVRLGRMNTVRGELVCESLDGRVDPSQLVDPGLKDPDAADKRRLETLVRLSGIRITADQWANLAGKYADDIAVRDLTTDDPVATADKIRRRLHEHALSKEKVASSKIGEASTLAKSVADIDMAAESDPQILGEVLAESTAELVAIRTRKSDAASAHARHAKAVEALGAARNAAADVEACLRAVEESGTVLTSANQANETAREKVRLAQSVLEAAQSAYRETNIDRDRADTLLRSRELALAEAVKHEERIAQLASAVAIALPTIPTDEAIKAAEQARDRAQVAVERGEVVRRAKLTLARAATLSESGQAEMDEAATIRDLARSTDQVLEQSLVDAGFSAIKVHDGRLCVESDRGLEPFSDLSHGERWRLALELAAKGLPVGSILPVCQEAFESLDPSNRAAINAMAKTLGLVILTAEATEGDLRAEVYQPSNVE